jgi:hypothetical protein
MRADLLQREQVNRSIPHLALASSLMPDRAARRILISKKCRNLKQGAQSRSHMTVDEMRANASIHTFPPTHRIVAAPHAHPLANRQINP